MVNGLSVVVFQQIIGRVKHADSVTATNGIVDVHRAIRHLLVQITEPRAEHSGLLAGSAPGPLASASIVSDK